MNLYKLPSINLMRPDRYLLANNFFMRKLIYAIAILIGCAGAAWGGAAGASFAAFSGAVVALASAV